MPKVDLSQDPADFANQATNEEPADPEGQPTVPDPGGAEPPAEPPKDPNAVPPEGTPTEPTEPTAEPKPEGGEPPAPTGEEPVKKTKPDTPPPPADPEGQPTEPKTPEEIEKERVNSAQKISELGEERANMFKTYLGLVEDNPDVIKDIYKSDPKLADEIVKEHWGYDSCEELIEQARVKELEETDPERAKSEQKMIDLKKSNKNILEQLKTNAESAFYTTKGIQKNIYDPNYKAIQAALTKVDASLKESNYAEALEIAHSIAFPGRTEAEIAEDIKKIALAKADPTPIAKGAGAPPVTPAKHTEGQTDFMTAVGVTPK